MLPMKPDILKEQVESEIKLLQILLILVRNMPETEPLVYTQLEHASQFLQDLMLEICEVKDA